MPKRKVDTFAALKNRSQRALIEFLNVDLNLAFTFLRSVRTEAGLKPDYYEEAIDKVRIALESVRRFQGRIEDPEAWQAIHHRANELEVEIEKLANL
jgi:hypothetical protein